MSYTEVDDYPIRDVYRGFSRDDILERYEVDVEGGVITSKSSGEVLLSKNSKGHLVVYCRKGSLNTHLQQRYIVHLVGKGHIPVPPFSLGYKDSHSENISLGNLVVIPPGKGVEPKETIHKEYEYVSDRLFYCEYDGLFCVRRGKDQSVYLTPYLDEAEFIRNEWKSDPSVSRLDRYEWSRYKNLGLIKVKSPKLDKRCVWHLYSRAAEKSHV